MGCRGPGYMPFGTGSSFPSMEPTSLGVDSCVNYQTATHVSSVPRPVLGSGAAEMNVVPALKELAI